MNGTWTSVRILTKILPIAAQFVAKASELIANVRYRKLVVEWRLQPVSLASWSHTYAARRPHRGADHSCTHSPARTTPASRGRWTIRSACCGGQLRKKHVYSPLHVSCRSLVRSLGGVTRICDGQAKPPSTTPSTYHDLSLQKLISLFFQYKSRFVFMDMRTVFLSFDDSSKEVTRYWRSWCERTGYSETEVPWLLQGTHGNTWLHTLRTCAR